MVEVFGARTTVHFSPKDLGLRGGIWDYFQTVRGWIFGAVFEQPGIEFPKLFSNGPD